MISFDPSPLIRLQSGLLDAQCITLLVKRDDLLRPTGDPFFCGNKVRKLKYNLSIAHDLGFDQLLTFGGAYSNHIAAVARAGKHYGFRTVGIIRGEEYDPLNPTLTRATTDGMRLHYLDRATYRRKNDLDVRKRLRKIYGRSYVLPEGGTNEAALRGCAELATEITEQLGALPDYLALACGTGGTMAGLIRGCAGKSQVLGISALKGDWMTQEIQRLLGPLSPFDNWGILSDYHFGGYAKFPPELKAFIREFEAEYGILLDPVYTAKLFYGIMDRIRSGFFAEGSTVVVIHSGGLQGRDDAVML